MRYGVGIVKWTKSELDEIDRKTREVMTVNMELNPEVMSIGCIHLGWKEGERQ